jgi:Domain of unknown function (DUF4157)
MRTTAHKTLNQPAPKQATHGRVQLKPRPGAGNRFRADNFERQADDFASRVLAGESGLAGRINPTSPAGFTLPASSGRPLDSDLREGLEKSFGADFTAVRIHSDNEAAGAAEDYGAKAFTSGRDIFFAGGKFQPQTREGKLLLAHELTHVLQQTGRVSEKGKLKATNRRGSRYVQLDAAIPEFPTLRKLHAPPKNQSKFDEIASELAKKIGLPDPASAVETYFNESLSKIKDWPLEAESLLFDTLKYYKKFDLASQLIERDDFKGGARIRTAAWTSAFVPVLEARNKGEEVYVRAAEKHPVLAWYVEEWLRLIEVFIFQPINTPVPLLNRYGAKEDDTKPETISDHLRDLVKRLEDNTKLSSSEWVYQALYKIDGLNDVRKKRCVEINNKAISDSNKTNEHAIFLKRRFAEGVRDWGAKFLESTADMFKDSSGSIDTSAKSAWEPFLKKLGARVQKIGASAVEAWDRKEAIEKTFDEFHESRSKGDAKALAAATKKLSQVKTAGEETGFPNELIHLVRELNRRGKGGESPAPADEFSARAEALVARLKTFSENKLEKPQAKLFHDKKTDDEVAYIWLTVWLEGLISNLRWVAAGTAAGLNVELIDQRIRQRLHFARRSLWLARALQWDKVIDEAEKVIFAKEEKTDQLAILPYPDGKFWHHDQTVPLEDLGKIITVKSWEPLTGTHLALLYRKAYYEAVAAKIKEITPTNDAEEKLWVEASGMIPFIAANADKKVRKLPFPQYWTVKDYDFAIRERSKTPFGDLIQSHASFSEITEHGKQAGLTWILPLEPSKPFAWFIPYISTVMPTLRGIDLLNAEVAAGMPEKDVARKLEKTKQLDDNTWLKLLSTRITKQLKDEKMTKEELQTLQAGVQTALEGEKAQAWKDLLVQMKRGARVDRQIIARWSIEHLDKYADTRRSDHPMKALEPIVRFFVAVSMLEDADIEAEMTALMLEIAPNLEAAFSRESRFDIVHSYLGWLEAAVKFLPTFQAMTVQQRHEFLPDYENKSDWLEPRIASLKSITEHFKSVRESVQRKSGYKTSATDQTFKVFMAYSSSLPAGLILYPREGQSILGEPKSTHYQVTKIFKDFVYHPAYGFGGGGAGEQTKKGKKKEKAAATGYSEAKFLELDDKTPLALAKDEKLLEVKILNSKDQEVSIKQVGPEDAEILADIHNGLAWAAFGSAMGNIQAGIEWYVNTMLDLAEFIPGVGQGIAAARILATIAEFWVNSDYTQIKSIISGGIREIVEGLHQRIKDSADPENLIQLLLFGDPRLDELLAHSSIGKGKTPDPNPGAGASADHSKFAKAKKAIDAFRRLGRALFKSIRKLHDRVQVPMEDFHTYAATRPVLALALNFIADNIFTIATIATTFYDIGTREDKPKGVVQELKDTLKEQQENFGDRFHTILKQFETLELPEKVIDMAPIIASVMTILENFLIGRLGLKAKAGLFILQKTGALDFFNERVADEIVAAGVDPNIYWREQIVPEIAGKFNETRDTVVTEINKLTGSPAFGGIFKQIPKSEKVTLTPEGEPFEETSENYVEPAPAAANTNPYPSLDRPLRVRPTNVPSHGPGQPLTPELLQRGESVLGRSLKHVRLHTGSESAEMTDTFGADALTTGSHIFMRPGLSAQSGRGAKVFQHELVHVLQQTGKRRRGSDSSQPIPGRPEMGLDYDPARERVADQVAESAGRLATQPNFEEQKDSGLQPSGINLFTIHKLLRTITDLPDIQKRQELLDKLKKEAKLPTRAKSAVESTLSVLSNLQSNTSILKYPDVFTSAIKLIHNRLSSSIYAQPMRIATFEIARQALKDLPVPKPAKGTKSKAATTVDQVIKTEHFARQLEGYILAKTGIVMALTFNETKVTAPSGEEVETIDETKPVKEIKILNIYLPYIDGRSPLWVEAVKNTWPGADEKKLTKIRIHLRALFEKKGIVVGIWAMFGKSYEFSYVFRKEVDALVKAAVTGSTLDPKDLTAWKEYAATSMDSTSPIGLRLATYEHPSQKAAGRESHHLTQFLLADYFSSSTSNKHRPFKKSRNHPGLTWEGNEVKFIGQKPGAQAVDNSIFVGQTKGPASTRGNVMPTISLAASTHKSGRLHITPEADDVAGTTTSSQAGAVNNEFERHMPAELIGDEQSFKDYRKQHGDDAIAALTYRGTQRTYKEIERRMSEALHARMPMLELEYYKEMAIGTSHDLRDKTNPDVKTKDEIEFREQLEKIPPEAKKHNKAGMLKLGWNLEKV